uniref:Gamma interferon-inducible thiol reductase n=1 Tax=Rhagovelia plumbea TaxID=2484697 RepID=A0A5S9BEH6_9HEMI|nr:gamma interferon-inducible thiol reductase [Rhagovelia plumbea]
MVGVGSLLLSSLLLISTRSTFAKVAVSVYYESLCPDSRDLFTQELCPNWSKIGDYVHLKLVPFGKASSVASGFQCQHGPKECYGNIFQSCAFSMLQPGTKQLNFACCYMANPYDYSSCLRRSGLAASEVRRCMTSGEGRELQLIAEVDTKHNTPGPRYVPTVVFNKKYNESDQRKIEEGHFMGVLCKYEKRLC